MADRQDAPTAAVAVAASAGGVEALIRFVGSLPPDFPAAVLVVLHIPEAGPSVLPGILARAGALPVVHGTDGIDLKAGLVVVAPPGQHLTVRDGVAALDHGPRENGHRPSADALFRSVSETYGLRGAGIVLSGTMDDGAAGLKAIGRSGGLMIVQQPSEAAFPGMPKAAIAAADPDLVVPVDEMARHLARWLDRLPDGDRPERVEVGSSTDGGIESMSELSEFTCPECGGTLWLDHTLGTERYRCRVGHTFSSQHLLVGKQEAVEAALWAAIVALEERADISKRLLRRLEGRGTPTQLKRYRDQITQTADRIDTLRGLIKDLVRQGPLSHDDEHDGADAPA